MAKRRQRRKEPKTHEELAEERVCETWGEAAMVRREKGEKRDDKIYEVKLPLKTVYVVTTGPAVAVGLAAIVKGVLPKPDNVTNPTKSIDAERGELHRQLGELEDKERIYAELQTERRARRNRDNKNGNA